MQIIQEETKTLSCISLYLISPHLIKTFTYLNIDSFTTTLRPCTHTATAQKRLHWYKGPVGDTAPSSKLLSAEHSERTIRLVETAGMEKTALVLLCLAGFCMPASNQIRKYVFVGTNMTWSEAQSYCRENHIDLATVRSQEEAEQLLKLTGYSLSEAAWIGLYRDDTQNWQWSNSDDVIYSNWMADLFCASVSSTGQWKDLLCTGKEAFMCYNETSNITERYTLITSSKTWTEAQQYCREHYTDLVSIKSASENEDLVKKAQGKPFWIGLFNEPWKWSRQGDNYTYRSWFNRDSSGEPNNKEGDEKCVVMNEKSDWYDTSCSNLFCFVCCSGGYSGNCSFEGTNETKTWHKAQSLCRNKNKDLATIEDKAKMNSILGILPAVTSTWIGLHRDKENWQWSNGDEVIYTNWRPKFFCASVMPKGQWTDSICTEYKPFMCYNETSNIIERYTLITSSKTWTAAQQYCREHHTDLVSIKSASENEDLVKKAQGKPFWIDKMTIRRVKLTAPRGMNLEDPKVSEAILEQIREHLSKTSQMGGVNLSWRKKDGEIFHEEEEEEEEKEEEGCPKP
ncbi:C-type mannose receptor 2-like isoform X2 [Polyodon spathula]|uniref:C-type mannose receptor 2-like isoform X2 n=1 Tax=Polyodon spathula TaxID=7913 RepID=UPI001B7DA480|nr:C-type mannose receptor 2-like isoform X2 [Polyodon spathula]